jgi:hypothetical protein
MNNLQTIQGIDVHIDKDRVTNMLTIADQFHKAGCFGKDVQNTFQAFAKIQAGAEMGIPPMEAMRSFYIVNGQLTMYGLALTGRLRKFGWNIKYDESIAEQCTVKISKGDEEYTYVSTKQELLDLKSRAASFALRDKLKWHAISRLCRFYVPEVLGSIAYLKEELEDQPDLRNSANLVEDVTNTNLDSISTINVTDTKLKLKEADVNKEVTEKKEVALEEAGEQKDEQKEMYLKKIKDIKSDLMLKTLYDQANNFYQKQMPDDLKKSFDERSELLSQNEAENATPIQDSNPIVQSAMDTFYNDK